MRSNVKRKVGGSSPPRIVVIVLFRFWLYVCSDLDLL